MVKNLSILGSTGSIGTQTLDVARALGIGVSAIAANRNIKLLEEQAREFSPSLVAVADEAAAKLLRIALADTSSKVLSGREGIMAAAACAEADTVMSSLVGMAGIEPTLAAIDAGKNIALANKETLVCAGEIVMNRAKEKGVKIIPVDSEHSAIFQSLHASCAPERELRRIILTASGGPFFGKTREELGNVTVKEALNHPNWSMGAKVTIDSASLMNKGLEFIEAMWLFGVSPDDIEIVVHRESIIHSMVEFCDGAVSAQLGTPDMRTPISFAMTYPERMNFGGDFLDFRKLTKLSLGLPDMETFRCLALALSAARRGGTAGAVLNGANEAAVDLFLNEKIKFLEIADYIERATEIMGFKQNPQIDEVITASADARAVVYNMV
ncbi:MAG: 1-deoxy-D-xylulose-5-phosphate reductoisomerase [Oscillospiraceae bacterium]|nr:1-deoxy-D-xylulose-5-phosphate reductoisomerase [Oscillospiraceae bacterium]